MMNIWMLLSLALATCLMSEPMFTSAQSDDLYLEDQSGDYYDDDDDYHSGSGSGDMTFTEGSEELVKRMFVIPGGEPTQDLSNNVEETFTFTDLTETFTDLTETTQLEVPENSLDASEETVSSSELPPSPTSLDTTVFDEDFPYEVQSENLFQRKEVLAAVIAGGVIGFLFAIFLILLLVYRMRKKDEGSYDLGERKVPSTAYQKAPTKEFYA
ncbi:syndecan-2 [Esox lucius]|uniref:Syndecan n=1 Tax=Esox lucius TaxID=8010 RepID=A0AAY5KTG5_ESOLU|nr:syndecan-2 [Esox lucius]